MKRFQMKKNLAIVALLFSFAFLANAQNGTWTGKLDNRGTKLTVVFHLDGDEPCMDSPVVRGRCGGRSRTGKDGERRKKPGRKGRALVPQAGIEPARL